MKKVLLGSMAVLCWSLMAPPVLAQRLQFAAPSGESPSPAWSAGTPAPSAGSAAPVGPVPTGGSPTMVQPAPVQPAPAATAPGVPMQATPVQPSAPTTFPGGTSQTISPPPTYSVPSNAATSPAGVAPGAMPGAAPGAMPGTTFNSPTSPIGSPAYNSSVPYAPPPASFSGGIQPSPGWDPYGTPTAPQDSLLSQDPYLPAAGVPVSMGEMQKFIQHINFEYAWFAGGNGGSALGINDVDLSVSFAFPIFANPQTPLLVTPGFAVHYWQGPESQGPVPADMPPRTYDAYVDFAWNPQLSEWFHGELEIRPGVYSDFKKVYSKSFEVPAKGLGVIRISPSMQAKLGVWYLDRNRVTILPAGGLVWTPNSDVYFNILFPDPKVGRKLTTLGTTEWWIYARGDYGGGSWTIHRDSGYNPPVPSDGTYERVDYNDIEVAVGLEFKTIRRSDGLFEVGGSFSRQLAYENNSPHSFYPSNTVFIRVGLAY